MKDRVIIEVAADKGDADEGGIVTIVDVRISCPAQTSTALHRQIHHVPTKQALYTAIFKTQGAFSLADVSRPIIVFTVGR